jgi:hypothetical protein
MDSRYISEIKIDRSTLSLVLQNPSRSFRHYGTHYQGCRVVLGVMWEKGIPRICKSSYGEKQLSNIFIFIYVNFIGIRANIYE